MNFKCACVDGEDVRAAWSPSPLVPYFGESSSVALSITLCLHGYYLLHGCLVELSQCVCLVLSSEFPLMVD